MRIDDVRGIARVGTKMSTIADVIVALAEPVILFVQWKSMMQKMRAGGKLVGLQMEARVMNEMKLGAEEGRRQLVFGNAGGHALSMVGLPRKYLPLVKSIVAGHTLIFLFNFSDRQLHGVYLATSDALLTTDRPSVGVGVAVPVADEDGAELSVAFAPSTPLSGRPSGVGWRRRSARSSSRAWPLRGQCAWTSAYKSTPAPCVAR